MTVYINGLYINMITKVVANLSGSEFGPVSGSTLRQQIGSFYASIGGVARSPFGDVLLDDKSVKSDLGHPNYRNKTCSFAAVKEVLENGIETKPMDYYAIHDKKQKTGVISANIMIKGQPFKMDVVVIKNKDEVLRVSCHDVYQTTLAENHHKGLITKRIRRKLIESPSCCPNGDSCAKLQQNNKTAKENTEINTENKQHNTNTHMKQTIKLTESDLRRMISESVKRALNESHDLSSQERCYQIFCNLEQDLNTIISNTDSSANQAFGSPDEKLTQIVNVLTHIDENLAKKAKITFDKLLEVISTLQDIRISLKTMGAKDSYWGHNFKSTNGTVSLSNYR